MKQLKGSTPIKGKRKLNNEETDSSTKPAGVAKRTRSSGSLVSENVPKRSTRSAQIDSFMEIPNYPQRKVNSDPESPLRRSKRLSTCSSTSSDPDDPPNIPRIQDHPRRSPRALRISDASKSDVAQNGNGSPAKCSRTKTNRSLSLSQNGVNNTIPNNDLHNGVKQESKPLKKATENGGTPTDEKRQQEIETDILNSNLEKLRNGNGICQQRVSQRKRHFSEDLFTPELRRQRRMSERGEMASVMEFVFNHKKSIHKSPKQSRSKKPDKRKPTTTSPAKSEPGVSNSNPGIENLNLELKINKIKTTEIEEVASKSDETPPKIAKTISEEENLNERTVLDDSGKISDENCQNTDFAENNIEIKSSENTVNDCLSNQSLSPSCDGVSEEMHCENKVHISKPTISIEEEEEHFMKWRKRELRSSGIKCQPDYYALSLDLMIHRTRTPKKRVEKKKEEEVNEDIDDSETKEIQEDKPRINSPSSETDLQEKPDNEIPPSTNSHLSPDRHGDSELPSCHGDQIPKIVEPSQETPKSPPKCPPKSPISKTSPLRGRGRGRGRMRGRGGFHRLKHVTPIDPFEPPPLFDEDPPTGPEVYFFESDHVALKHNTDYHSVLKTASILQAQRKQALDDLEVLQDRLKEALKDPIGFVDQMQRKVDLNLPTHQNLPTLPAIDWSKYTSQFGTFEHVFDDRSSETMKPFTRKKCIDLDLQGKEQPSTSSENNQPNKTRAESFKKSWTVEEQRKLEELLVKYPQEAVEFNRFRKIAAELQGRTPLQVQSRVQKYFIKLAKAGFTIPGRMPRLERMVSAKPKRLHKHRSHPQTALTKMSTFFSNFHVPVRMGEEEERVGANEERVGANEERVGEEQDGWEVSRDQISDEEDIPGELRFSDEYLEILRLKRMRRQQLAVFGNNGAQPLAQHHGFQCDICQLEPIQGIRYHCIDCPVEQSVDLCQSCIQNKSRFETPVHKSNHRLEPVCPSAVNSHYDINKDLNLTNPFTDNDYTKFTTTRCPSEFNYLDPNYLPANR